MARPSKLDFSTTRSPQDYPPWGNSRGFSSRHNDQREQVRHSIRLEQLFPNAMRYSSQCILKKKFPAIRLLWMVAKFDAPPPSYQALGAGAFIFSGWPFCCTCTSTHVNTSHDPSRVHGLETRTVGRTSLVGLTAMFLKCRHDCCARAGWCPIHY